MKKKTTKTSPSEIDGSAVIGEMYDLNQTIVDLNQEVNALRRQLRDAEAVIRYLERKHENPEL